GCNPVRVLVTPRVDGRSLVVQGGLEAVRQDAARVDALAPCAVGGGADQVDVVAAHLSFLSLGLPRLSSPAARAWLSISAGAVPQRGNRPGCGWARCSPAWWTARQPLQGWATSWVGQRAVLPSAPARLPSCGSTRAGRPRTLQ